MERDEWMSLFRFPYNVTFMFFSSCMMVPLNLLYPACLARRQHSSPKEFLPHFRVLVCYELSAIEYHRFCFIICLFASPPVLYITRICALCNELSLAGQGPVAKTNIAFPMLLIKTLYCILSSESFVSRPSCWWCSTLWWTGELLIKSSCVRPKNIFRNEPCVHLIFVTNSSL